MKKTSPHIMLLLCQLLTVNQLNAEPLTIHASYPETKPGSQLICAIFDRKQDFLLKPINTVIHPTTEQRHTRFTIELAPGADYALSLYIDNNNNEQLDTNFFGIPSEPVGTSNNAKARFGPPSFEDAKFRLEPGKQGQQSIVLDYAL